MLKNNERTLGIFGRSARLTHMNDAPHDEAFFYNALAVHCAGNRTKLERVRAGRSCWADACEAYPGFDPAAAKEEWGKLAVRGVRLVMHDDDEYPPLLREIPHPPFGIYVTGTLAQSVAPPGAVDGADTCAIVGTRKATPEGKTTARYFARELARAGFRIVSGLAFGIDAAAHEGCLEGNGITIAVLAGGLNSVYPRTHAALAHKIVASGGALVSEYPLGAPPFAIRFVERNRLVSGLSRGLLVVEAPRDSGALATARFAFEQDRDVFVVPGSIAHPNFFGSHELIRQGAELVTRPEDILRAYGVTRNDILARAMKAASPEEMLILTALADISTPAHVDKISAMTKLEPRIVNQALSFLVIEGVIKEKSDGYTIEIQ